MVSWLLSLYLKVYYFEKPPLFIEPAIRFSISFYIIKFCHTEILVNFSIKLTTVKQKTFLFYFSSKFFNLNAYNKMMIILFKAFHWEIEEKLGCSDSRIYYIYHIVPSFSHLLPCNWPTVLLVGELLLV